TFRVDLYYRLNVFPIRIPSLRERRQDIPLLAEHFLEKYCKKMKKHVAEFTQEAMEFICGYDFPGNVRELENLIERAVILSSGSKIEFGEWFPKPRVAPRGVRISTLEALERDHIMERMQARRGNIGLVASDLGISRTTLWRRMKKYQIETRATVQAEGAE
ncbi:MAG: helix-turn-helix domain-containing protein, partial [Acidobacteriota bacterium]